mmetsp:Transcript_61870/g.130624  ORF Transcript_61870/g.130624 Transcript_61870/m.130624 type:complete len:217 (+) Transcript_61870:635-1285(+)
MLAWRALELHGLGVAMARPHSHQKHPLGHGPARRREPAFERSLPRNGCLGPGSRHELHSRSCCVVRTERLKGHACALRKSRPRAPCSSLAHQRGKAFSTAGTSSPFKPWWWRWCCWWWWQGSRFFPSGCQYNASGSTRTIGEPLDRLHGQFPCNRRAHPLQHLEASVVVALGGGAGLPGLRDSRDSRLGDSRGPAPHRRPREAEALLVIQPGRWLR